MVLVVIFVYVFSLHTVANTDLSNSLIPESVYRFSLSMFFEADDDVEVATFLPIENSRQEILDENISAKQLEMEDRGGKDGRYVEWHGNHQSKRIGYSGLITLRGVQFDISRQLEIPDRYVPELRKYLLPTDVIPVHHEEIKRLWSTIKPKLEDSVFEVLSAIYSYTYKEIKNLPFKGLTDSLTAIRLGAASCNGKSRLFVSLARLNNIPSRLVGGIILNGKKKKTSHQWVEVYIDGHWVPFDVTNGHFAALPKHYLELYRGDHQLFRHTSDINFGYYFNSAREYIAPALYRDTDSNNAVIPNASRLLQNLGLSLKASYIFMLLPLCAMLIAFLRNVIGITTFGTFMPMLIAAACVYTGFIPGVTGFLFVLTIAFIGHGILGKFHVLKVPRLSAIITLISIVSLIGISLLDMPVGLESGVLALFPAVIISFTADRIHQMSVENNWQDIVKNTIGTLLTIWLCFQVFNSILLQGMFIIYPELLLLVLAVLLYIGSWTGMRVSEVFRFKKLIGKDQGSVLGINERNRELIYRYNDNELMALATDKLSTKRVLESGNIPCPETVYVCQNHAQLDTFLNCIDNERDFVIKPNSGSRGNGILILTKPVEDGFLSKSNKLWDRNAIKNHVIEILSGNYSQSGEEDFVYIEPIIRQHDSLTSITSCGLSDIRLIVSEGKIISTMLRVPTLRSDGKANLHQGAVGISINIESGKTERAIIKGQVILHHPDSKVALADVQIPFWEEIKDIATRCHTSIQLGYMGVDICIDEKLGPLVLEVNCRPGLEIQNVQDAGIGHLVQRTA